ncbi:MAG: carbohydrate ABC transporter permease [Spirochaetaceae bacterium]|jgi:multiple sugar transport system permease protein|nr:carbohydrate ABC transporter permease [Spirochaetaceae bacterium]
MRFRFLQSIFILALCAVFIMPFTVMLTTSFKTLNDAFSIPVRIFPRPVVFDNYPAAISKISFFQYMGNTAFITFMCLLGQLLVTPLVAYSLAKIAWRGANVISGLLMMTMMIPYTVTMIPLYKIWHSLHLTNTYAPLIVPAFFGTSFYIIIMRQFMKGIPQSLLEAAKIDGATELQRYCYVALPLCKPALTTIAIYSFLNAWSDYLAPLLYISKKERLTLSLGLQQFLNEYTVDWNLLMAAAVIFIIPILLMFIFFQRNFVEGIATTGIKA